MTKDGFECYKMYLALQRHFSTSYDFHKYHGKVNASTESYSKRNDMFSFEKMSNIVLPEDRIDFFIAHFLDNPKCWIRNMSKTGYEKYKAHIKNFPKRFRDDLETLSMHHLPDLIKVNGDIPQIHKMCISGEIALETLIAMDKFFPFLDKHKEEVKVALVFPDHIDKLINYRSFFAPKVTDLHKDIMKSVLLGK